jgi:hypothetical protein
MTHFAQRDQKTRFQSEHRIIRPSTTTHQHTQAYNVITRGDGVDIITLHLVIKTKNT